MEDRLAHPKHPCNVMLYHSTEYDNWNVQHNQCYGWITRRSDTEVPGAKETDHARNYHVYTVGEPLRRFLCDDDDGDNERNVIACVIRSSAPCDRCGMSIYNLKKEKGYRELVCGFCVNCHHCSQRGGFLKQEDFTKGLWET